MADANPVVIISNMFFDFGGIMKRNKKVIGLIVSLALVVSTLFATSVESVADSAPSGFPQVGDGITCTTNIMGEELANVALTVESITPYVITSDNWDYPLTVYFY